VGQTPTPSIEDLAKSRHEEMAPRPSDDIHSGERRDGRVAFCKSVVKIAREIANELMSNEDWTRKFSSEEDSEVRRQLEFANPSEGDEHHPKHPLYSLRQVVQTLMENLRRCRRDGDRSPLLVFVFDEASSLVRGGTSDKEHAGLYIALNRIISCCFKEFPMWFFFLATDSLVGELVPPSNAKRTGDYLKDTSARRVKPDKSQLKLFPPFVALQLDVEDRSRMQDPAKREVELRKPMADFTTPKEMAIFGRPLWYAYTNQPQEMYKLAKLKLLGGQQNGRYDAWNQDHVFAALSFRLSLDVCLQNPQAIAFASTAVNFYMRVVVSIDHETGLMDTVTPSEPVLAKAAMEHLCEGINWTQSIITLTSKLFKGGLVEKGLKGELYARLMLILAHDWVRLAKGLPTSASSDPTSRSRLNVVPKSVPELMPTFTVSDLLKGLYADDYHTSIDQLPGDILEARMNFTHFVPAYENLGPKIVPELCQDLLRRCAAMQLAFSQPTYDLFLPVYFGKVEDEFKVSECGFVVVQVRNKKRATTLEDIFKENFEKISPKGPDGEERRAAASIRNKDTYVFNGATKPILFLLFDLGVIRSEHALTPLVQVSRSNAEMAPDLWSIHSRGYGKEVFGCLGHMDHTDAYKQFFASMPRGGTDADQLSVRNKTFFELGREFRYPEKEVVVEEAQEGGVIEQVEAQNGEATEPVEVQKSANPGKRKPIEFAKSLLPMIKKNRANSP
jgi:hypothetical protein